MNKLKSYISPKLVIESLKEGYRDLMYSKKFKSILSQLEAEGKLKALGFRRENNKLFVGVNLNPELLMYTEDSQESVELKFVSDAMRKYTDFLQKEGILDSIVADYDRVQNEEFYGYVVEIRYQFKKYKKKRMIYDICYLSSVFLISAALAVFLWSFIL